MKNTKEQFSVEIKGLLESGFRYFIIGSPENLNSIHIVKSLSLKEMWEELWNMDEINKDEFYEEYRQDGYLREPDNYGIAIRTYIKLDNRFHYNQAKTSLAGKEKIDLIREIVGEMVVELNNGRIIGNLYEGAVRLNNILKEEEDIDKESMKLFKKEMQEALILVKNIDIQRSLNLKINEL